MYRSYLKSLKKFTKKQLALKNNKNNNNNNNNNNPPVLQRPTTTTHLQTIAELCPVPSLESDDKNNNNNKPCRMLYRSLQIGPELLLLLLDVRGGTTTTTSISRTRTS